MVSAETRECWPRPVGGRSARSRRSAAMHNYAGRSGRSLGIRDRDPSRTRNSGRLEINSGRLEIQADSPDALVDVGLDNGIAGGRVRGVAGTARPHDLRLRADLTADRSRFRYKDRSAPFYGANRPGSTVSQGLRDWFW